MSPRVPATLRRRVRERFFNCCAYCRSAEALSIAIFELEHVKPQSAGGETVFENLCLACPTCNRRKADREEVPNVVRGGKVTLFRPTLDLWDEHFAWSASMTELVGLSEIGLSTIAALKMNRPALVNLRELWVMVSRHPPRLSG